MPTYDLTPEAKAAIIEQRLQQFAAEKFQHELNRDTAAAIGDTDAEATATAAITTLNTAIAIHQQALTDIDAPSA
jgi:hypothetical protein